MDEWVVEKSFSKTLISQGGALKSAFKLDKVSQVKA